MFLGHFAVALAAKRAAPRTSLGTLFAAALWLDLLWPALLLFGTERVRIDPGNTAFTPLDFESYPWSHGLVPVIGWSIAAAVFYRARAGYRRGAAVVGLLVFSHWVLDFVTHRPDLPLWPEGPPLGLGLWRSVPGTLLVELALFALGVVSYARATRPRSRAGTVALWSLVAFLLAIYAASALGPPPPSPRAVAWGANLLWLFVVWGWWIDLRRAPVPRGEEQRARPTGGARLAPRPRPG